MSEEGRDENKDKEPLVVDAAWTGTPAGTLNADEFLKILLRSWGFGLLLIAIPCVLTFIVLHFIGDRDMLAYSFALLLLLPFAQGYVFGYMVGAGKLGFWAYFGALIALLLMDYAAAGVLLHEGVICLLMALPMFLLLGAIGLGIARFSSRRARKKLHAAIFPLALLFSVADGASQPDFSTAISDAVTINAPPEIVWHYIVSYPENTDAPDYWLWKAGLPLPVQSVASENKLGAARECRFTKGVTFREKIIALVPAKTMTFEVTEQPKDPELMGHFRLDKGQLQLERNADGTTTVIATSWYHLFVQPAAYFNWWATDITRNVHFRVLNHMKALAEAEAAGMKAKQ